jgi:hypothetical protein
LSLASCTEQRGSIGVLSVAPLHGKALVPGESVLVRALVSYRMIGREGSARMFVQQAEHVLGTEEVSLFGNEGTAVLETKITVPNSGDLDVRVALFESGQTETLVIDRVTYQVGPPGGAL